ncbi:MAG: protein kinase domain-containing protein [Gammaproteobacteria bacterium]
MTDSPIQNFVQALDAFRGGNLPLPKLLQALDGILVREHAAPLDLLATLLEDDGKSPLPTEAFEALQQRLLPLAERGGETLVKEARNPDDTVIEEDFFTDVGDNLFPGPDAGSGQVFAARAGEVLNNRYELIDRIGSGGTSIVYQAIDRQSEAGEARVAVKILNDKLNTRGNWVNALKQEAQKGEKLDHPGIVKIHDFGRDGTTVYLVMEYLSGALLSDKIRNGELSSIGQDEAARIVNEMGKALEYAHRRGVIHCDFKPTNVFLTSDGHVKIIDFGIASALDSEDTNGASDFRPMPLNAVTPVYASPERLKHQDADPRDDVFSLGCTAYELLTGVHPFGRMHAAAARKAGIEIQPLGMSDERWSALKGALAFDRDTRTSSVSAFLAEFNAKGGHASWYATPMAGGIAALLCIGMAIGAYNILWVSQEAVDVGDGEAATSGQPLALNSTTDAATQADGDEAAAQQAQAATLVTTEAWNEAQLQLQAVRERQRALTADFESQQAQTEALRNELEEARVQLAARQVEVEAAQQFQLTHKQAQDTRAADMENLESRVVKLQAEVEERRRENEMLGRQNQEQRSQLLASIEDLQNKEQQLQEDLEGHRKELLTVQTELQGARDELKSKRSDENRSASEVGRLETRIKELETAVENQRSETIKLERQSQDGRSELLSKLEDIQQREQQLQATLVGRNEQVGVLQEELVALREQQTLLEAATIDQAARTGASQQPAAESQTSPPATTGQTPDSRQETVVSTSAAALSSQTAATVSAADESVPETRSHESPSSETVETPPVETVGLVREPKFDAAPAPEPDAGEESVNAQTATPGVKALVDKGHELMQRGDFSGARLAFKRAADWGSAEAARAVGQTYDPVYLAEAVVQGVFTDLREALRWYERAVESGDKAAHERMDKLNQWRKASGR